ncbi:RICIN domain-containing protein [Streptomyces griseus]|uniref:RICIN domain-containing protein n=1 Tax=Streptomyces griseus TaxID=1911 RepID=UPI0005693AA9|nr:RICIN domain-containing protein [Streptomyces griseus]
MTDAGPSNSPTPARRFDATDEQLTAELTKWTSGSPALHPVGELLDRHWEAAFAYARLCTDGPRAAGMLTTAAFTRLFGASLRQSGPSAAWRPHLLVTVRRIAAEWDADGRRDLLHPALRSDTDTDDGARGAARLLPAADRRMLSRAFQRLSQSARCLLWHTEVEGEPLAAPAGLLGLDEEDARVELRRARERLRDECLQAHRELAPDDDCRRYHRLLDVTCRRGAVDLDPDLRAHLEQCMHCRHTAGQLEQFNGTGLGLAVAEGVLGWGARAYLESRAAGAEETPAAAPEEFLPFPGEPFDVPGPATGIRTGRPGSRPGDRAETRSAARKAARAGTRAESRSGPRTRPERGSGSHDRPAAERGADVRAASPAAPGAETRAVSRRADRKAARRARRRNLAAAVLTVSGLVVLPLVLWSALGSGDGTSAPDGGEAAESPGSGTGDSTTDPSWAGDESRGTLSGRLHNVGSGLCVGIAGTKAVKGAEIRLAACSSAESQQWTYETDGLLRNAAAPDLCLDSHLGYSVRLAPCTGADRPGEKNVRYDFTLQGTLVPRWDQDLALTPAATDGSGALVLKNRADDPAQRWAVDTSKPDPQMKVVNWGTDSDPAPTTPAPAPIPKSSKTPAPAPTPTPTAPRTTPAPTPTTSPTTADPCSYNPYYCSWDDNNQSGGRPGGHGGYGGYPGYGGYGYGGYGYGGYGGR